MTTPPPEPPPGGWPPYGPYPHYGPDPYRRPPPDQSSAGVIVGLAIVGAVAYFAVNFVAALLVLMLAADSSSAAVIATGAVGLALFAFGGGAALIAARRPWTKGLGMGLMIGWALTSICTVGICTGINPTIYGGL